MKTKYLFTALAMPALFAACTSEEFMAPQNGALNSDVLAGREKGELILDASRADALADATTRIVGEETTGGGISWLWEGKDDKIGATVVDYKDGDDFPSGSESYVITNYPFAPKIEGPSKSATFSTPTAVVSGAYLFYNKYDGESVNRRNLVSSLAGTIQAKAGIEEGLKQVGTVDKGGQNFFISPIIDLALKDTHNTGSAAVQKPIQLTSIYSVLKIRLKTELEDQYYNKGFRVNKVVLKSPKATEKIFERKITISPKLIQKIQKDLRAAKPENQKYFKLNGAIDAMNLTDAEVNEALDLVNTAFQDPNNLIGDLSDPDNELVYQLDKEFVFNADNKDAQLDILVVLPSDKYEKMSGSEPYEKKQAGVFLMTVYTSEGIYNSYIMNSVADYTFQRGKMYQLPVKTMKIGPGTTNVELFDQSKAFDVETTQDWNYAVNYINEHYRDYGEQNNWVAPVINLHGNVEVDAEHYFPNFPVKYSGKEYTIKLKGQNEYKIDPTKAIFDKTNLPKIDVTGQNGATIVFDQDIKADVKATNGDDGTETIKLVTDAKVVVNDGKEVNFSSLETKNEMNVGKGSKVNVNDDKFVTNGKFNVGENATVTATVKLENKAEMIIAKGAEVTVPTQSYNENKIDVTGTFKAEGSFENKAGKTIVVKSHEQEDLNMDSRGTAKFETLNNKGIINIDASAKLKGTYGGLVEVTTLNNGVDQYTKAEINVNGELMADNVNNEEKAVIKLLGDDYALIQVDGAATNKGTVELTAPAKYEMFDTYYSKSQNIAPLKNGNGFIVATLTNDLFYAVKKNHEKYSSDQETALKVLEKIYLNGEVTLVNVNRLNEMDVVLNNGSTLKIGENIAINNITTDGSATINSKDNTERQLTVNGTISVPENKSLTIGSKAKVFVQNPGTGFGIGETAIDITGTLTNNGMIDCPDGSSLATYIYTMINGKGEFNNNGRLCKEGTNVYTSSTANFTLVQDLINALQAGQTKFTVNGKSYIVYSSTATWNEASVAFTKEEIKTFFTTSKVTWTQGTYSGVTIKHGGTNYYIWPESPANSVADFDVVFTEAAKAATAPAADNMFTEILNGTFTQKGTQFNIMNNGTLYLKTTDIAKNVWAYGVSKNSDTATKTGKFTNEE